MHTGSFSYVCVQNTLIFRMVFKISFLLKVSVKLQNNTALYSYGNALKNVKSYFKKHIHILPIFFLNCISNEEKGIRYFILMVVKTFCKFNLGITRKYPLRVTS